MLLTNTPGMAAGGTHVLAETDVIEPPQRSTRAPGGPRQVAGPFWLTRCHAGGSMV